MTGVELVDLRLRRAQEHIDAISNMLGEFLKSEPYTIAIEPNIDRSEYLFRLRISDHPPPRLAAALSDVIHNLRSCLDNIVFVLAGQPLSRWAKHLEFPIFNTGRKGGHRNFAIAAKKKLRRVHPSAVAIIESVQPYHGFRGEARPPITPWPPFPLAVLRDLSNFDKHRAPHIAFFLPTAFRVASTVPAIEQRMRTTGQALEDNAVIAEFKFGVPDVHVEQPSVDLKLATKLPGKNTVIPLAPYLDAILGLIELRIFNPLKPFLK